MHRFLNGLLYFLMPKNRPKPEWYLIDGVARVWDGEKWRRHKWSEPQGWYEFQGKEHYWDGNEWSSLTEGDTKSRSVQSNDGSKNKSSKRTGVFSKIALTLILGFVLNFVWHLFTDSPSTESVCYTFAKATDSFLPEEERINSTQWWDDNIKTEQDLERVDAQVLKALELYSTGEILDDVDPDSRMGLRDYVIEECEIAEPGSTEH